MGNRGGGMCTRVFLTRLGVGGLLFISFFLWVRECPFLLLIVSDIMMNYY